MTLEVSENTHEQKLMIVVGSTALRGEDMPARGLVTVLDIIDVVPDPERDESGLKLAVISAEETKGAITAVESFPGGLIGTAQGQKLMIRGLKEDGSCLPVAFLDAQCHATTLKTLNGRGLWLLGDICKGLWFGGFTEEPYKITVLGKSVTDMEVICAELLPFEGQLYILVVDGDADLHILQYDPENPKTVSGMRLLHRSSFHIGHFPTSMTLLPSTLSPFTVQEDTMTNGHDHATPSSPLFHVLLTSASGSIDLITALDETTYRRLSALQIHLTSILEHTAGLNPRAYRACVEGEGFGGRGVVDGNLIRRIFELGTAKRRDVLGRAAGDAWRLRSDLEIIGGGGLAYL
jgi:cleavage and polyadenylation specificity factor subunit 1